MQLDTATLFGAIGAAAVVGNWITTYFGVKQSLNGSVKRIENIERMIQNIPDRLVRLETLVEERTIRHELGR